MWKKKKKHNKTVLLARSKLNSIENMKSKALTEAELSHDEFTIIINGAEKYHKLREKNK